MMYKRSDTEPKWSEKCDVRHLSVTMTVLLLAVRLHYENRYKLLVEELVDS